MKQEIKKKMKKLNNILKVLLLFFVCFSCKNHTENTRKEITDSLVINNDSIVLDNDTVKKSLQQNVFHNIVGKWIIKQKYGPDGKRIEFKSKTDIIIKDSIVVKSINNEIVLMDTLILLHNLDNEKYEFVLKKNKKWGINFSKTNQNEIHLSFAKDDGGFEIYYRDR